MTTTTKQPGPNRPPSSTTLTPEEAAAELAKVDEDSTRAATPELEPAHGETDDETNDHDDGAENRSAEQTPVREESGHKKEV